MAFSETPDGGIAGHSRNAVYIDCKKKGRVPDSGTGQGRLASCMTCPDNDHIIFAGGINKGLFLGKSLRMFHVKHSEK
jgi:hypothetical protein